jgi:hypothetical protein
MRAGPHAVLARAMPRGARMERGTDRGGRRWSGRVATVSTFPPSGLFAAPAEEIAATMARPEVSPGGLGAAIRMVTFFANRAGRKLPDARRVELERAKRILQAWRAAAPPPPRAPAPGRYRHAALGPVTVAREGRHWAMRTAPGAAPIALGPDGWRHLAPEPGGE